jgi:O-antigen biosynthesis protein
MHQSSFNIITCFRELVAKTFPQEKIKILDVGSYGVNGTYKEIFSDSGKYCYTGLDVGPGPNVDYVPADPYYWPELHDESFEVIISGQAFEHIEYPWLIIEEMNRVLKKNGLICIVAPSRGPEHKYPVDCWRYYPDGFRALAKWAHLEVLEAKASWGKSGFADGSDQWGDTCCILFKPEIQDEMTRNKRKVKYPHRSVNRSNPLNQTKQNSYYGFARPEVVGAIIKNKLPTGKVLEIGCAGGETGKNLKERLPVQSYVGIDISPEAAATAKISLDRVIVANIEETDLASEHGLKPGEFDLLLALDVLEHLYDPWDVLAELSSYVKPGGHVVASLPNIQNITIMQDLIKGNWRYQDAGILDATHLRFFTLEEAKKMFTGAGFMMKNIEYVLNPSPDMEKVKESGNTYRQGNLEITNLTREELLHLFTYQYILIAQKASSADALNAPSATSAVPNRDILLPHFKHDKIVPGLTSIIILTFNQLEYTKECVKSLRMHTPEPHEIIFVDNGSTDGTEKWLKTLTQKNKNYALIGNNRNLGFAKGCNQGIEASRGESLLLLNNDVVVAEGWLSGLLDCLSHAPAAGIVGPTTNNISGLQRVMSDEYRSVDDLDDYASNFRARYRHRRIPLRRIVGFCMLFKRALAEQIGLLDEGFGTGNFEDDDFCLRAALEGYKNYIAGDVHIHHFGSRSFIGNKINYGATISGNRKIIDKKWTLSTKSPAGKKLSILRTTELADDLYQQGKTDRAVATLINCIKLTPEAKEIYYELARILTESKRFSEAWEIIESMPLAVRDEPKGLECTGFIKEGLGLDDEATAFAERILSQDENCAAALNLKGVLAYKKDEKETAKDHFQKAIDADPGYGEAHTNLGVLYWGLDNKDEALANLRKGFVLSPTVPDASSLYYSIASSLDAYDDAVADFREASRFYPNNKNLSFLCIDLLIRQTKFAEALIKIQDALALFGPDEETLKAALAIREKVGPLQIEKASKKNTLSLCMIVKNEERHIINCLKSVRDIVDEMIVVDTGSTDRTKDIAQVFGAKVFDFRWTGDFSAARNHSLEQATGDWILVLDADEVISPLDHKRLLRTIDRGKKHPVAFAIVTRNYLRKSGAAGWKENDGAYPQEEKGIGWFESTKVRLFRNNGRFRFENPVHELLEASLRREGIPIERCAIPIHHYGRFDHDKLLAKGQEYYLLGRRKLEERGGGDYDAVRELAVQAGEIGKYEEAIDLWQQALALRPDMVEALFNLAYNYIHVRKYQEALNASKRAVKLSPGTKDAVLNYALSEMLMGNILKTKTLLEEFVSGENEIPTLLAMLGASYFISGDNEKGLAVFRKLAAKQINMITYVNSLLEQLIASGQIEYFNRLIDAALWGNMTDRDTLRRQVAPLLNNIAGRLHAQGKKDEALVILKAAIANGIDNLETTSLYDAQTGT